MSDGMIRASRLQRLTELLLSTSRGYTIQEIADRLGVHRTTAWRDVNELSLAAPVQEIDHHYLIDRKDYAPNLHLTGGEGLMLYLALGRVLGRGSNVPPMLAEAIQKLTPAMGDLAADRLLSSLQSVQESTPTELDRARIWETLIRGWLEQLTCRIKYKRSGRSTVQEIHIQPYMFEPDLKSDGVYMVGWSSTHEAPKILLVGEVIEACLTTQHFERLHHKAVDFMLRSMWGSSHGSEPEEVHLRFHDPVVAQRIRARVWVPSQRTLDLPGGGVEWFAVVPDVFEVVPWIRGWGNDCEIVSPAGLRDYVEHVIRDSGGVTMATTKAPDARTFTDDFYASLQELFDGEKIRTCLQCSTCSGICPAGMWMEYPPRTMISALRANEFDAVMDSDSAWLCVSCYACTEACPACIPLTAGLMTRTKEELVLAGAVPRELQDAFENTEHYGNPLGKSKRKRAEWADRLVPKIPLIGDLHRPVDVLWFVGDYASYHARLKSVSSAFAKVLQALAVDFAILGPDEWSDGDSVRLAGERGLFESLASRNAETLGKYEFGLIVTTDPHAYNALKNEYPKLGIAYPVQHYTEFLADHLPQLEPMLTEPIEALIAYHDPCYLGRVNKIYDPPRALIEAIPGVELVEMSHTRENSLCCGGGGGGMWLDGFQWEKSQTRLSEWRVREAVLASKQEDVLMPPLPQPRKRNRREFDEPESHDRPRILAVACPYEAPRFEDACKVVPEAADLVVKDLAELLAQAMGL